MSPLTLMIDTASSFCRGFHPRPLSAFAARWRIPLYSGILGLIIFTLAWSATARAADTPPRLGGPLIDGSVIKARGCGSHFFVVYGSSYLQAQWLGGEIV